MDKTFTYLDYNATSPLRPEVQSAISGALERFGNPSSVHRFGRLARQAINEAREHIATAVHCNHNQVIFTGSGTEANNQAIRRSKVDRVLVSAVEHESVLRATSRVELIPVDKNGLIDLEILDHMLSEQACPTLVSIQWANNETGVIQPMEDIVEITKNHNALIHTDAVQAFGKVDIDFTSLDLNMMTLSAHKVGGPQGIGALIMKEDTPLRALIRGGGQERSMRSGTENMIGIIGFGAAAALIKDNSEETIKIQNLRDGLESKITAINPSAVIYGSASERLPNTSNIGLPGLKAETQVMAMDLDGVAISAGAACSSGKVKVSHVLSAMGMEDEDAGSAIRVSLGWQTTEEDIERFLNSWQILAAKQNNKRKEENVKRRQRL